MMNCGRGARQGSAAVPEFNGLKSIHLKLSGAIWRALEQRHDETGEPIPHIIRAGLAEYLEIEHSTLFQVSTSSALVEGVYNGAVSIGHLREHGDFGLGTFEGLDGELVALDGSFFQVRSDGTVRVAAASDLSPFAAVTWFKAERSIQVAQAVDLKALLARVDELRDSGNVFYAIRIDGSFAFMHTRAMCKSEEGTPLAVAAAHQPEFKFSDITGTLAGFWSPRYVKTLEVPGYHLHFISDDRGAGGHLLECSGRNLRVAIQQVRDLHVALPENQDFLKADLTGDPAAALDRAEHARKPDQA
jgi:acetolactate decarboxylase